MRSFLRRTRSCSEWGMRKYEAQEQTPRHPSSLEVMHFPLKSSHMESCLEVVHDQALPFHKAMVAVTSTCSKRRYGRFRRKGRCPDCGGKVFWVQNISGGCATVWLRMWESRHQKENPGCWGYHFVLSLNCCWAEDGAADMRVPILVYTWETLQYKCRHCMGLGISQVG